MKGILVLANFNKTHKSKSHTPPCCLDGVQLFVVLEHLAVVHEKLFLVREPVHHLPAYGFLVRTQERVEVGIFRLRPLNGPVVLYDGGLAVAAHPLRIMPLAHSARKRVPEESRPASDKELEPCKMITRAGKRNRRKNLRM